MDLILDKERELWKILYPKVKFDFYTEGKEWIVKYSVELNDKKYHKGIKIKENQKDIVKRLELLRKNLERTAIYYFTN